MPREDPMTETYVDDPFWTPRLAANRDKAIYSQWERYEEAGTISNFRIAAGLEEGPRRGFFYSDSDLHKWADAACRVLRAQRGARASKGAIAAQDPRLASLVAEYVALMRLAQEPDGYLFTYNQLLFPGARWKNLMIEHELYCHGHFIEAGIAHRAATGSEELFALAVKAADLVVAEFREAGNSRTSGHEEIELALLKLYRITRKRAYLETAGALLERRGRTPFFGASFAAQAISQLSRSRSVARRSASAAGSAGFDFSENLTKEEPPFMALRAAASFLSGSYQQQHAPIRRQLEPRGHAVRWAYMMTAVAMLQAETGDPSLASLASGAWERLVREKMYVSGGIGSLPLIEGFGRPYELDNRYAYSETCAAIGSILWNRELSLAGAARGAARGAASAEARYADLLEWQLYNAAMAGISLSGDAYFYRNPLSSKGGLHRRPWYATACCPSNLSRLLADLGSLVYAREGDALRVDQYIGGESELEGGGLIRIESGLPWQGRVRIHINSPESLRLKPRLPGWAFGSAGGPPGGYIATVNGESVAVNAARDPSRGAELLFGPSRFDRAAYLDLAIPAGETDIELDFGMDILRLKAPPELRPDRGRVAVARGPLLYCAESVDNPGTDLEELSILPESLRFEMAELGLGAVSGSIVGSSSRGRAIRLLPYAFWGNRGDTSMAVWLREGSEKE
jgi:DUF1680 family protein